MLAAKHKTQSWSQDKSCNFHHDSLMLNVRFYSSKKMREQWIWQLIEHKSHSVLSKIIHMVKRSNRTRTTKKFEMQGPDFLEILN